METLLWPLVLLAAGIGLIFLEIFIPSGGILSVLAACAVIFALVVAFQEGFVAGTVMLLATTVVVPLAIAAAVRWWPHTPIGRLVLIKRPENEEEVLPDTEEFHRDRMIGKQGIAVCDLLPSGDVRIDGRLYDAVSRGTAVNRGELVRVVDVNTQRLVVRPLNATEIAEQESSDDVLSTPIDSLGIDSFDDPLA